MRINFQILAQGVSLLLAGAGPAFGGTTTNLINVQYLGSATNPNNPTNAFSGTSGIWVGPGVAYSGAGVLGSAGDTWNQKSVTYYNNAAPGPYFTAVSLVNSANSASGLTLTLNYQSIIQGAGLAGTATDAATTNLMQSSAFIYTYSGDSGAGNAKTTHMISGLSGYAGSTANLVVYAGAPSAQMEQIAITGGASGGNSGSTLTTSSTSRSLNAGAGVAYNNFTNCTLTGGNLVFTVNETGAAANANAGYVNGFQLQIITPNPLIATQPVGQSVVAGTPVSFSVGAAGTAPLSYQWQATNNVNGFTNLVNGGQISGANTNNLTISNVTPNWALVYRVIVTNSVGSVTSAPASLTVQTVPVITTQPVSQTTVGGSTVSFNVVGTGGLPLSYQWQATNSGTGTFTNLVNGVQFNGVTNNVLTLSGVTTNWPPAYQVILANSYGSVTSTVANLSVLNFVTQPVVPDPGAMGPTLAANVTGSWFSPPANFPTSPSDSVTAAPVTGNGDMAITVGGASSALQFYVGKADFWGVEHGIIMPVGSLTLSASALSGSSYALSQNVGPATVTGNFVTAASSLSVTSWVASAENTAVIQLNNNGTSPLSLTSQLLDGFAGSTGNPATYGSTNNSTWLNVSPDTVYIELGNQMHNAAGTAPFTGRIADLRLYNQALSGSTLASLDGNGVPTPLLRWSTTNQGTASLVGSGVSLNTSDPHGGSAVLTGNSGSELAVGDLPLPENQFTFSTWINVSSTTVSGNIVTAQVPYADTYGTTFPYPYTRGLTLNLAGGKLSASLNQSGYLNLGSPYQTFYNDSPNNFTTTAAGALPANQWIQAAVTYDGNSLTIYTNGVQVGTPVIFPTGLPNGMMGWNKMATHLGDTNVIYNGCAPQGVLMQSVVGATATTSSQGALTFTIPSGGQVTIALAAVTDRNKTNYFAAAQQQSQSATPASLTALFQAHSTWWSNFWTKSFVQIPNQLIQNNWYGSLYLLACCSTSNSPPPGLWGNFITGTQPQWGGDYTLDYNYEAPFWGALACNHSELAENYDKVLLDQISRGRATAQYCFPGNNGIYFYCHLIPAPGWADDPGSFWGQKSDAIFAAVNCAMRWKYTQDTNYAAKVYPYLKGVADFWNSYLTLSGNQYVDINDSAWEQSGADNNPSTSLAFIQLVYPALVQMSQVLNVDAGSRAQWNDIIARLVPQTIVPSSSIGSLNGLGAPYNNPGVNVIRASSSGTDFPTSGINTSQNHQLAHSSAGMGPCQVIYPGWNIGLESAPATLLAASNTIWLAAQWYDNNNMCNFYPGAACVGYDPNAILSILNTMLAYYQYPNFMVSPGGGGTENYTIVPSTLAAMFVQSYQTNLHVFPDWPTNQSAAFGNLNACGGFLVSGAITLGTANYVQIQSTAGQMLKLANPWPGNTVQCVSSVTGTNTLSGSVLYYQTQMGEVLTLNTISTVNLPAPTNLTAVTNGATVALNWNAVPGAAGYNVKRATSIGGPFLNLTSGITGTNYTDATVKFKTTYYYVVTALVPGFESTNSPSVSASLAVTVNSWVLIDVDIGSTANVQTGAAVLGGAGDIWNGVTSSTSTITDATGNILNGVGFSDTGYTGFNDQPNGSPHAVMDAATTPLMRDCVFGQNATFTVSLTGLTAYTNFPITLVVYGSVGDPNQGDNLTLSGVTGGNTASTLTTSGASRSITNAPPNGGLGVAYQTFTGTLTSGTLTITCANNGNTYGGVNGFQLLVIPNLPPTITTQPVSQTNVLGGMVSFNVAVSGTDPLSYQWQANSGTGFTNVVNGGQISGATSNVLAIASATPNWTLAYQVIVTNSYGAVTSSPAANLTLLSTPVITTQPVSQTNSVGSTVAFNVVATGAAPLNYQWQASSGTGFTNLLNGGPVSGATSNVLTIAGVTTNWALGYQVIVTNSYGAVTSAPAAMLSVIPIPTTLLINVDFGSAATQTGAAVLGSSNDVWNPITATTGVITNSAGSLLSGVGLNLSCQGVFNDAIGSSMDVATTPLMQDYAYGTTTPAAVTVSLTGLTKYTNCPFTLVLFGAGDASGQGATFQIIAGATGGNTASNLITTATSRQISVGIGIAYQTFTGTLTNGTLTFTAAKNAGQTYVIENGFQLQLVLPQAVSSNAYLTSLVLSPAGILSPAFVSNTFTYYATNAYGSAPTVLVTNADLTATNQLIYNGTTNGLASGQLSAPLTLTYGVTNVVQVQVTAQDGVTVQTYTMNILVAASPASTNAWLTSLALNPALTFTPSFASNVLNYAATEAYGATPTVSVTDADLTATNHLVYNGTTNGLASGQPSGGLALTLGATNMVQVQVTAQDGVTVQTYTVNVTELPNQATQPLLTNSVSNGTLDLSWGLDRLGYRLLMQTNNLNLGVSGSANDWTQVPGSTATNAAAISIVTTNLNEYFRLVYP